MLIPCIEASIVMQSYNSYKSTTTTTEMVSSYLWHGPHKTLRKWW